MCAHAYSSKTAVDEKQDIQIVLKSAFAVDVSLRSF